MKTATDWYKRRCAAEMAERDLWRIADSLRRVGAQRAALYARKAAKSAQGAARHAHRMFSQKAGLKERNAE